MRKGSECTRISPEITTSGGNPMFSRQASRSDHHGGTVHLSGRDTPRQARGGCRLLGSARWTAARLCRRAKVSVVTAFRSAPSREAGSPGSSAASRSPECTPARNSSRRQSGPVAVIPDDSHKSEAVEECIRFMNSSSRKYR